MKIQRHFAPTGGRFQSESVARFIGICSEGESVVVEGNYTLEEGKLIKIIE
ncbi:MAG: hypothetical protein AB1410_04970 [Acidobacteriota bacterium]